MSIYFIYFHAVASAFQALPLPLGTACFLNNLIDSRMMQFGKPASHRRLLYSPH
jgi:hypothetical protein